MTANTSQPAFNFRTGGNVAEEAEKAAREAMKTRDKTPDYFSLKEDKDTAVVRLLTDHDDWITVEQHNFVPTKPGPKDADNWPKAMTAVCRRDVAFAGHYDDCYICDSKLKDNFGKVAYPKIRVWALAVERELVRGDGSEALGGPSKQGIVVGIRDKVDEIEEKDADGKATGTTLRYPRLLIINQPMKSFFSNLKALHGLHGTVCDRDFVITRDGTGTETAYRFSAMDPVDDVKPGTPTWEKYLQSVAEREINLGAIVADKAADSYYARFFDPTKSVDKDGNVTSAEAGSTSAFAVAPAEAPSGPSADLRARIRNLGQAS